MSTAPFRLLDLPQELQSRIYEKYFEDAQLRFETEFHMYKHPKFKLDASKFPSLGIERVSRKVNGDSRAIRNQVIERKLMVDFDRVSRAEQTLHLMAFIDDRRFAWMYPYITEVEIHITSLADISKHYWGNFLESFRKVSVITILDLAHARIIVRSSQAASYAASVLERSRDEASCITSAPSGVETLREALVLCQRDGACLLKYRREWQLNVAPAPGSAAYSYIFWNKELHFNSRNVQLIDNTTNAASFIDQARSNKTPNEHG